MGLFSRIKKKEGIEKQVSEYFKLMNAYTPTFSTFEGSLYEMELTRAAVHSFATHVSKLRPEVRGSRNEVLARRLQTKPNELMDTKKYLYRLATVYSVNNTAFIAPILDRTGDISGFYPLATEKVRVIKVNGIPYVQYEFGIGQRGAIELAACGRMTQFQNRDELFGSSNEALLPTLELLNTNRQGIVEGVKNSATIRFMAKLASTLKPKDIEEERKRFIESNLATSNNGGVMMFDQKYSEVKQITSQPFCVDSEQMKAIKENVFEYFGTNEKILTNNFNSAEWNAYYEGKIEPFAIEASLVHSNMAFTEHEIAFGNEIIFTANRLQYLSAAEKVQMVTQLFDRGFITQNDGREIFNLNRIDGGDKYYIRKEYTEVSKLDTADDVRVPVDMMADNSESEATGEEADNAETE